MNDQKNYNDKNILNFQTRLNRFTSSLIFIILYGFSCHIFAFEIDFKPRFGLGYLNQEFKFEQQNNNALTPTVTDYTTDHLAASLAATFVVNQRFSLSISGLTTKQLDSKDNIDQLPDDTTYNEVNGSISLRIYKGWRVFVGGRMNRFEIESQIAKQFRDEGPYAGISTGISVGNSGVFSLRASVGQQTGRMSGFFATERDDDVQLNESSEINAYSFGVSWNDQFSQSFGYTISLDYRKLDFDLAEVNRSGLLGNLNQQQTLLTFSLRGL